MFQFLTIVIVIANALHSLCIRVLMFASRSNFFGKNKQTYYFVTNTLHYFFPRLRSRIEHDSLNLNHAKLTCNPQRFIHFLQLLVCPLIMCPAKLGKLGVGSCCSPFSIYYDHIHYLKISLYCQVTFNGSFDHMSIDSTR